MPKFELPSFLEASREAAYNAMTSTLEDPPSLTRGSYLWVMAVESGDQDALPPGAEIVVFCAWTLALCINRYVDELKLLWILVIDRLDLPTTQEVVLCHC